MATFLLDCMKDDKEDEALHMIALMGVRSLCFDVEYRGTPFHYAMKLRLPRIVSALLKKGVIWDDHKYAPEIKALFECIENNKQDEALDLVRALDVTSKKHRDHYYNGVYATTLMHAVYHRMIRVLRALLEKLADPDERESLEKEVMVECLKRNMQDEALDMVASMDVKALNQRGYNKKGVYVTTLMQAVQFGRNKVVRALLEKRIEWDEPLSLEIKAVFECIESNKPDEALDLIGALDVKTLNLLADYGQGVYVMAIMYALQHGQIRVVRALLVKGAEWDKYHTLETKALFECLERNMHNEALNLIASMDVANLNLRADYKDDFWFWGGKNVTALMYATQHGEMRIVKALLEKGVDVNIGRMWRKSISSSGVSIEGEETPLCYAIKEKHIALMDMLLEHGADPLFTREKIKTLPLNREIRVPPTEIAIELAFRNGGSIFNRTLQYSNMNTEFGSEIFKHTCLCFAVKTGLISTERLKIHQIIQRGGVVCSGKSDNTAEEVGIPGAKGICSNVFNVLKQMAGYNDFHTCHKDAHHLLTLLCATDYVHENSCLYKTIETYIDTAKANIIPVDFDELDDRKIWGQTLDERRQILTWMTDITKQPSTLKHICRVYIRRSIPKLCTEAVETLPLPIKLIDYVNVVDRRKLELLCPLK